MASSSTPERTKHWHKISVDAVRGWITALLILVLAVASAVGYGLLKKYLLERQVVVAMEEAADLVVRLRKEEGLGRHLDKYGNAKDSLEEARRLHQADNLNGALVQAERSRSLLVSISDTLRHRNPAGEAQFVSTQGGVEVRRGERGEWRPAHSRTVVYAGDYIKTAPTGSAEVMMLDGTLFTVRPGTVMLISRTSSLAGLRSESTLTLESGWVNLSTSSAGSRVATPTASARVERRSEALVTYDQEASLGRFAAYRGELEVASAAGDTRRVAQLQQVVQRGDELSAPKSIPDAPQILVPEDNTEISLTRSQELELRWRTVQGAATYALQISRNRLFAENIIDVDERGKTSARLGLKRDGAYFWRVAAFDRDGEKGPWSPAHRFRVVGLRPGELEARLEAEPTEGPRPGP